MTGDSREGLPDRILSLEESVLFSQDLGSIRRGDLATSAVYFIIASTVDPRTGEVHARNETYQLLVVDESVADDDVWVSAEGSDSVYPYVVPADLAKDGIIRYMHATFFDPDNPTAIEGLRPYLQGPITDDTV
jgi:hypothetical protein